MTLLEHLEADDNYTLGLQTGNLEKTGRLKLQRGELDRFFPFGGFGSDSSERKVIVETAIERGRAHISPHEITNEDVFVIGDSVHDVIAGNAAGATTVAIATGACTSEDLQAQNPDYLLPDLANLEQFLKIVSA